MSNELGTLVVVVLKARNLNDKHSFYKQDVFAQVSLNGNTKRTKVDVKGGQHPIWDEEIRFPVMKDTAAKFRKLEVACFAKEHRSDDILGRGIVDLTDTLRTGEFDEWISLNIDGVVRGDLYLEITYFANAPVPAKYGNLSVPTNSTLARRPSKLSPSDRLYRPYQAS
ncbi:C2 domain-containing protein, partial [Collybia nuda]